MISRVIAEFSSPEAAESAVKQIKSTVDYVYSGNIMCPSAKEKRHFLSRGTNYAVMPVFSNSISIGGSDSLSESHSVGRNTTACIICGSGAVDNVIAAVNAMGGMNIRSAI